MNVYTCVDHDSVWVGGASVVVAASESEARALLRAELFQRLLDGDKPFTLQLVATDVSQVIVLRDGDY